MRALTSVMGLNAAFNAEPNRRAFGLAVEPVSLCRPSDKRSALNLP